jgi:peptide-methionine (S)-S-oxide reductase
MWYTLKPAPARLPDPSACLLGRSAEVDPGPRHAVYDIPLSGAYPTHYERILVGMGCFWGAERLFWSEEGVYRTAVGYAGGYTPNPTYEEVCAGQTAHTEVVEVIYDPAQVSLSQLLKIFWERHDPTQGMRQGNDVGTQYRSALYWETEEQQLIIEKSRRIFETALETTRGHHAASNQVTTEIRQMPPLYYAEPYHQQYLHTHPQGYCGLRGTGVQCVIDPSQSR